MLPTLEELQKELSKIREELQNLIEVRDRLRIELDEVRNRLNEVRDKITATKNRIKEINSRIEDIRRELNILYEEKSRLREKMSQLYREIRIKERSSRVSTSMDVDSIRRRIEELEWRIITTPNLDVETERKIINEISMLERTLQSLLKAQRTSLEVLDLRTELDNLRSDYSKLLDNIKRMKDELNNYRNIKHSLKEELSILVDELNRLKAHRDKVKEQLSKVLMQINELRVKMRDLLKALKNYQLEEEKRKQMEYLSLKRKVVEEKIKKGERLTLEDLIVLYYGQGEESESGGEALK